ncbi:DUF4181 domain-containing protein [Radiobacillus kanasensis]|uniref:DUF4181 domain-containing protein n=1 Tax=Radiobacillus kanasensis TaxID=2844358 RepID=UPI001E5E5345|nr:DUF4181 domain-containing protein [Radiobacillus kanasensis]UFT97941.1 DUF4181 domain-containing protein [Radiobacillus kanasensis]
MYGGESDLWIDLILILGPFFLLLYLFNKLMRKLLNVKKKKFFSYNHVNDRHKKIDWTIRISFMVILLLSIPFNMLSTMKHWYLQPWFLMISFLVISEAARAVMEWKYAANRKDYLFTISQTIFIVVVLVSMFTTRFFGLVD